MAYTSADYARFAKDGFLLGLALLLAGATGELLGHAVYGSLPTRERTLFD